MPEALSHYTTAGFWEAYARLPAEVQQQADSQFERMKADPHHPSLRFQPKIGDYWAARVNQSYRALARYQGNGCFLWVWIGTHREYEHLLKRQ